MAICPDYRQGGPDRIANICCKEALMLTMKHAAWVVCLGRQTVHHLTCCIPDACPAIRLRHDGKLGADVLADESPSLLWATCLSPCMLASNVH